MIIHDVAPAATKIAAGALNWDDGSFVQAISPHDICTVDQLVSRPQPQFWPEAATPYFR